MSARLSKNQKGTLADIQAEVYRVACNGKRDFSAVCRGLQDIVEGRFLSDVSSCVANVEQQLNTWQALGAIVDVDTRERVLRQAVMFKPLNDEDTPLVTGGFGYANPKVLVSKLWNAIVAPTGYTRSHFMNENESLRYAPGMKPRGGMRLVHYQHNAYAGISPKRALAQAELDHVRLAGVEVLEMLLLDPRSSARWDGVKIFSPHLSGLQMNLEGHWSSVLYLRRWDEIHHLELLTTTPIGWSAKCSSPFIKEC
jgi:hypothetical protein